MLLLVTKFMLFCLKTSVLLSFPDSNSHNDSSMSQMSTWSLLSSSDSSRDSPSSVMFKKPKRQVCALLSDIPHDPVPAGN